MSRTAPAAEHCLGGEMTTTLYDQPRRRHLAGWLPFIRHYIRTVLAVTPPAPMLSTSSRNWTWPGYVAPATSRELTAPRSRHQEMTSSPSATSATAGWRFSTYPILTSAFLLTSSGAGCGKPSTSSKDCCRTSPISGRYDSWRYAGPVAPGVRVRGIAGLRPANADPQLGRDELLPPRPAGSLLGD